MEKDANHRQGNAHSGKLGAPRRAAGADIVGKLLGPQKRSGAARGRCKSRSQVGIPARHGCSEGFAWGRRWQ
jgi:hypothetical protein